MKRGAKVGAFIIAGTVCLPQRTAAQPPPPFSVEATFGPVFGHTAGEYRSDRQGSGLDMMLGARVGASGSRGVVVGANVSLHSGGAQTLVCYLATTRDGCIQPFPFFHVAGALVGWENARTTLRVMGGPAWAHAEGDALAWQARLDGSLSVGWRLALVGSLRGTVVPNYRGDVVTLAGLGLGVRVR